MNRPNSSSLIYLCLVFLSGVLLGSVGFELYHTHSVSAKENPCSASAVRRRYIDEMQTRLRLQPEQVQKLSTILEETHFRFQALRQKYKPELKVIQEEQAARVRAILNTTQQTEFDKIRQERERGEQPKK